VTVHTSNPLTLSENLGIIIEIADTPEKIRAFSPVLRELADQTFIEEAAVQMIRYGQ
jgi:PII-like signaling protein